MPNSRSSRGDLRAPGVGDSGLDLPPSPSRPVPLIPATQVLLRLSVFGMASVFQQKGAPLRPRQSPLHKVSA